MSKYNMIDTKQPDGCYVRFERVITRDDCGDRPDERDDGFWPSHDKDACGYVLPENFDAEQARAVERMRA